MNKQADLTLPLIAAALGVGVSELPEILGAIGGGIRAHGRDESPVKGVVHGLGGTYMGSRVGQSLGSILGLPAGALLGAGAGGMAGGKPGALTGAILGALLGKELGPVAGRVMGGVGGFQRATKEASDVGTAQQAFWRGIETALEKGAAPIFRDQTKTSIGKKRDVPHKVIEIANAIRRDDPSMSDEAAYRIAWDQYRGKIGGKREGGPIPPKTRGDPTGIRGKMDRLGARAYSHPKKPIQMGKGASMHRSLIVGFVKAAFDKEANIPLLAGGLAGGMQAPEGRGMEGAFRGAAGANLGAGLGGLAGGGVGALGGAGVGALLGRLLGRNPGALERLLTGVEHHPEVAPAALLGAALGGGMGLLGGGIGGAVKGYRTTTRDMHGEQQMGGGMEQQASDLTQTLIASLTKEADEVLDQEHEAFQPGTAPITQQLIQNLQQPQEQVQPSGATQFFGQAGSPLTLREALILANQNPAVSHVHGGYTPEQEQAVVDRSDVLSPL